MSLAGKIRKIHGARDIAELEEFCSQNHVQCAVRVAEIRLVENLLDRIDAAVAARDYTLALQLVGEWAAAYSSVKSTSDQEALKTLAVAEILSKLKEKDPRE
jgi:hypothetical protein